jgi:hypothetical protein
MFIEGCYNYTPAPRRGRGVYCFTSVCPSTIFFVTFFSVTWWQKSDIWWPINSCWEKCDEKCAYMFNVYRNQLSRQTGSRNLMDPKTLPTIWGTYMKLVTKYQISAINSYWEKYDEKYLGRTDRGNSISPSPFRERGYNYDDRDLIFGHKLHIGTQYCGKRFWIHQIPTSCLPILLIFIHI